MNTEWTARLLKEIFIENDENFGSFCPISRTKVKKPAKKMKLMLEEYGFDLIESVVLEQME